jgi:uncharacterized protein
MFQRKVFFVLQKILETGKSLLLIGPRQTGKTTLVKSMGATLYLNLLDPQTYTRYLAHPQLLAQEIDALCVNGSPKPLIVLDEVQRLPVLLDLVQILIDDNKAQFVLTGSSVKKLTNLLPGRVFRFVMDPLMLSEITPDLSHLDTLLWYGTLPGIYTLPDVASKDIALASYFYSYLEEEIRREALVRKLGAFSRFWEAVCQQSGQLISFRALSQDIGVTHATIASYFELLEKCLLLERFDPISRNQSRSRLIKSSKYCLFDMGIRRIGAREGVSLPREHMGHLFETYVGLELRRLFRSQYHVAIKFWRDANGPEVDWVIDMGSQFIPVEVKYTATPTVKDARHLQIFMDEYPCRHAYVVCQTPRAYILTERITALPWCDLPSLLDLVK